MEPAERSCAWGGPVITVNWFNMGMDGKKDVRERKRGGSGKKDGAPSTTYLM